MHYKVITGFLLFIFLLPVHHSISAQITLKQTIRDEASMVMADPLGNIYWVNKGSLTKYDPAKKTTTHYTNRRFGDISMADVSDPLNIILYFRDFGEVILLDNHLSVKDPGRSSADVFVAEEPSLVCASRQEGFWAYFPLSTRLKRYDFRFEVTARSPVIQQLLPGLEEPVFMTESRNRVYLSDYYTGVAVFDKFGDYLFLINLTGLKRFQVLNNALVYLKNDKLKIFDFLLEEENVFLLPETGVKSAWVQGKKLILLNPEGIHIYELSQKIVP